jgi:hypothetical protein
VVVEVVVDGTIHGHGQCSHCQVAGASEHQVSVHLHCKQRGNFLSFCVRVFNRWSWHLRLTLFRPRSSPSMHTHNSDCSGQAIQFSIWTIWATKKTSAQAQANLNLMRNNSLKFRLQFSRGKWISTVEMFQRLMNLKVQTPQILTTPQARLWVKRQIGESRAWIENENR